MVHSANEVDVLIVGAGPVGLFLANECARRGLNWRIIEENSSQSEHSKALAIFPRTLEIFDMAGIVAPFLETANRVTSVAVMTQERTLAHMRFEPEDSPYAFVAMVPQNVTERLLVRELDRKRGTVEYNAKLVSAGPADDAVSVTVEHKGEPRKIVASFVVGCDGAHSQIRHALNLRMEGGEYDSAFMLADIETATDLPADELQLCPSEFGPAAIFPISPNRRRIVATVDEVQGDAPSLELVRNVVEVVQVQIVCVSHGAFLGELDGMFGHELKYRSGCKCHRFPTFSRGVLSLRERATRRRAGNFCDARRRSRESVYEEPSAALVARAAMQPAERSDCDAVRSMASCRAEPTCHSESSMKSRLLHCRNRSGTVTCRNGRGAYFPISNFRASRNSRKRTGQSATGPLVVDRTPNPCPTPV